MKRCLKQQLCQFVDFKQEGKRSEMICHCVGSTSLEHVKIFYFKLNVSFCLLLPPSKIRTNHRNIWKSMTSLYPDVLVLKQAEEVHGSQLVSESLKLLIWFSTYEARTGEALVNKTLMPSKAVIAPLKNASWYIKGDILDTTESANKSFT